jgi:hypothetical protein
MASYQYRLFQLHNDPYKRQLTKWHKVNFKTPTKTTLAYLDKNFLTWTYINIYQKINKNEYKFLYRYQRKK